mgnify:CR=1 FL=1
MKGLMMKEIIMIKKMTFPIIIFLAAGVMSGVGGGNPFFCLVIVVFLSAISMGNYNRDELSKWNQYSIAMPWDRKTVVSFRYIFMIIMGLISTVLSSAVYLLSIVVGTSEFSGGTLTVLAIGAFVVSLIMPTICTPIAMRFSSNTALWVLMLIGGCIGGFSTAIFTEDDFINFAKNLSGIANLIPYIIVAGMLLLYAVSWMISLKFYQKKDI